MVLKQTSSKKTKKKKNTLKKSNKNKKIYKNYGPGLLYLIFDGKKHVFKFIG